MDKKANIETAGIIRKDNKILIAQRKKIVGWNQINGNSRVEN